jgi:hypothetical protein
MVLFCITSFMGPPNRDPLKWHRVKEGNLLLIVTSICPLSNAESVSKVL